MPSRVLREGLADSELIALLSDRAFRLYIHLHLAADDYGLVAIDFGPIRKAAPLSDWNREIVAKMLCELADGEVILPYEVDGKRYAAISKWKSKINSIAPKHPIPSFGMNHMLDPYGFKSADVRNAALKIINQIKSTTAKGVSLVVNQTITSK